MNIKKFVKEVFNMDAQIQVVEKNTFIDITNKFFELKQANKLPPLHDIPILKEDESSNLVIEEKDETIERGKELFGDSLKIEQEEKEYEHECTYAASPKNAKGNGKGSKGIRS